MIITKLKQVEDIASKYLNRKIAVFPLKDISATGRKGIKIIVGQKENPAFDPKLADLKWGDVNIPSEYLNNKQLFDNKTNPLTADVRILWLPAGTTDVELQNRFLKGIKTDLDHKNRIVEMKDDTLSKIDNHESDADIAARLAKGENITPGYEDWDEGYEEEDKDLPTEEDYANDETDPDPVPVKETSDTDMILEAIGRVNSNVEVLAGDFEELSARVIKLESVKKPINKGKLK